MSGPSTYLLSIGLNVGPREPIDQLSATLSTVRAVCGPAYAVAMGKSEWNGVPERFVHVRVPLATRRRAFHDARLLAVALRQESVAVLFPEMAGPAHWWLVSRDSAGGEPGGTIKEFPPLA